MSDASRQPPRAGRPRMPGYGIVAENEGDGLLPWSWAAERLSRPRQYFLTTVRPDGRPHVMILWGLWLDDRFWFSTDRSSRKARNLADNPHAVVTPEGADEAVIVEGVVAEVSDAAQLQRFCAEYERKYGMDPSGMGSPTFALTPRVVFGQIEKSFTKSATRWQFD